MAQLTQSLRLDLADTFSGYIKFLAHFFQRSCSAIIQTKAQTQYFFFSFCQSIQYFHELFLQQSKCCRFCGCGNIVIGNEITQMAVFFFPDRSFQRNRLLCNLHDFTHFFLGHLHFHCQFFCGRFTTQLLQQLSGNTDEFVDGFYHMHRDTNGTRLICNGTGNCLSDPPCCIGREFKAFMEVEFFNCLNQPQITFLNQIQEQHPTTNISFCDADYQTQVRFCQFLFGFFVAFFHTSCQFNFFLCCQQGHFTNFFQIHTHRVINIDAFGQCQIEVFFHFFLCFDIPEDINTLAFQIFIDTVNMVSIQFQFCQLIHYFFIFQYALFLFPYLNELFQFA